MIYDLKCDGKSCHYDFTKSYYLKTHGKIIDFCKDFVKGNYEFLSKVQW